MAEFTDTEITNMFAKPINRFELTDILIKVTIATKSSVKFNLNTTFEFNSQGKEERRFASGCNGNFKKDGSPVNIDFGIIPVGSESVLYKSMILYPSFVNGEDYNLYLKDLHKSIDEAYNSLIH